MSGNTHASGLDVDHARRIAEAWREVAEVAQDDGGDIPRICEGCSMPATTTDGSEDRLPLCDGCARACEDEWRRQAAALLNDLAHADLRYAAPEILDGIRKRARALVPE